MNTCHKKTTPSLSITRTRRRKKTVSAQMVNGNIHIKAPMHIAETELHKIIENLTKKLTKKTDLSLKDITKKLNKKYFNNKLIINSIEYSAKQKKRFGSCQTLTARILISERLKKVPKWVLEYVIFHEMAHLIEPNHGQNFKKITAKFPLEERAKGFLLAMSYELYDE